MIPAKKNKLKWKCTKECKVISQRQINAIVAFRAKFDKTIKIMKEALHISSFDDCPNYHYVKRLWDNDTESIVQCLGHPLICHYDDSGCTNVLRILRAASVHYGVLRKFLCQLYVAIRNTSQIDQIDDALKDKDIFELNHICGIDSNDMLLTSDFESIVSVVSTTIANELRDPNIEHKVIIQHALTISQYEKEIADFAIIPCLSCECLFKRSQVTKVKLTDVLGSVVWPLLKNYITENGGQSSDVLYMCNYCKNKIKNESLPPRCVLNGLYVCEVPDELSNLDALSVQLIQLAKAYQTVVRLGTYTGKVPSYSSLKASKGTMFFLPLPINKTIATLDQLEHQPSLPDPELYIILNCSPTKQNVLWRSLVNISDVKKALEKLKEINHLYRAIDVNSVDENVKNVIETVNSTTSTMIEEVSKEDIAQFQSYTIRNLDTRRKSNDVTDIDQFKLLNVKEVPLSNKLTYLDVMCFPTLYPTGEFGEFYYRSVKLSHSEFAKSRLLNKDSRFRKNPQYIFYLLWQKEMRELQAGIYNVLKCSKGRPMAVGSLMSKVDTSDEHLESNLCTMLQSL
jgi:hypothetical protein